MKTTATSPTIGKPVELGRYEIPTGERVLVGRRIEGIVHVFDLPQSGRGRRYFVEAGFHSLAELAVLLADYRRQAARLGACPMCRGAIDRAFDLAPTGSRP
jgi:hypothetical protein